MSAQTVAAIVAYDGRSPESPSAYDRPVLQRHPPPGNGFAARGTGWWLFVAFLLGLGARLQVQFIGFIPFSELAIGLLFPALLPTYTQRGALRSTRLLLPLGVLWLVSTLVSDFYWTTELSLAARGVARVLVYLVCIPFAFVFFAHDTWRRLIFFTLGLIPSVMLSAYVFISGAQVGREIVWGRTLINFETHWVAVVVFIAQLLNLLLYHRSKILAYGVSLAAGGFNFYNGSRSAGAAFAAGVPLVWARNFLALRGDAGKFPTTRVLFFLVLTSGVAWAVVQGYSYSAKEGLLGERSRRKFESQASNPAGLVLTGRIEFVGGVLAAMDSPIVGHGSWKLDTNRYYARAYQVMEIDADPSVYYAKGYPLIPSHSHLMGAWVENGLGGLVFWAYALLLVAGALWRPLLDEKYLRLWVSCTATAMIWHILFSPISSRLETTIAIAVFLTQTDAVRAAWQQRARALPPATRAKDVLATAGYGGQGRGN